MTHTRKEILERLSAGEIDVDRAAELLNQVHEPEPAAAIPPAAPAPPEPARAPDLPQPAESKARRRWLHIHVSDLETGRHRVRVNVPLGLLQFGMKVGARFTNEMDSDMMANVLEALRNEDVHGTLVEVEDVEDNERVHIFVD